MTPGGYELDHDAHWTDLTMLNHFEDGQLDASVSTTVQPSAPMMEDEELDSDDPDNRGMTKGKNSGLSLTEKLAQRPDWKELEYRGILLDNPATSASLSENHRALRKRRASKQLEKTLLNRPDPQQLQKRNILKSLPTEMTNAAVPSGLSGVWLYCVSWCVVVWYGMVTTVAIVVWCCIISPDAAMIC